MAEYSSGIKLREGDKIKGYLVKKVFDPGGFAFASKAVSPSGRTVFFKKYKRPGGNSPWLQGYIEYQSELKQKIQADAVAKNFCYEFIDSFDVVKSADSNQLGLRPLRAYYQVFEWVEGESLRTFLDKVQPISKSSDMKLKLAYAKCILEAVVAIHKSGVVHSDLKPENVLILEKSIKLVGLDFSIICGKTAPWHGEDGYVGTPGYMSPEHLSGYIPEKASDVFTLAIILAELLGTGHPVGTVIENYEMLARTGSLSKINIIDVTSGVEMKGLNLLLNASLSPDAAKRPTAEEILNTLS